MVRQHLRSGVPASRPEKTRDGRFGYEAAGNPASRPLVFLHGIGGAARAWPGQLDAFKDPDPSGMELARDCMASVPEATYRATMLALIGFDLRGALKNISVPTLLLSGSKDNNAPAPMMAKMANYIPTAVYVELEGVGHLANLERPGAFNAALDQFLKANAAATQVTA